MQIEVSKRDWRDLMRLIERASVLLKAKAEKPAEYNVARRLRNVQQDIIRKNGKQVQ